MGQPVSRLFAMLGTYFPAILRRQHHARRGAGRAAHGGVSEYSGDELSSTIGKGCGSTSVGTPFFGNFFLMGGELYDTAKPEVFLFGDQQDLDLFGNKPVKFPYCTKGVTDSVNVLNSLVNVRKDSVKFSRVGRAGGGYSSGFYRLEFIFDCDVSCYIQIHFCAKEVIDEHHQQAQIVSRQNHFDSSERYHFPIGANQQFSHFVFKPHRYDMKMMHWDGGSYFPVVIEIRSVTDQFPEQMQMTMCSIERSTDQSAALILKPLKQKLVSNGVVFLLQEIFGIENKENAESVLAEENGAECIICMANPRDTMILPCRHLCICNGCAETLRYKLNNCPICRSPFKALLKIRAMRSSLVGMGSDGTASTMRIRREPLTLFEAINGPFHTSQSGTLPHTASSKTSVMTTRVSNKGNVVTTAAASSSSSIDPITSSNSPKGGSYFQKPQSASKIVIKKREPSERIELDIEHIELEELDPKRRKSSHSSSFIQYSPGSNSITRRSSPSPPPSLWRAHSPFSTANSSYQSARSIAQQKGTTEEQEDYENKTKHALLASAPNLAMEADVDGKCDSPKSEEVKPKNAVLDGQHMGKIRQKGQHAKRMSEPPTASSSTSSVKQQRAKSVKTAGSNKSKSNEQDEQND